MLFTLRQSRLLSRSVLGRAQFATIPTLKEDTYYNVLGVSSAASSEEIKLAYREMAKKYHPDVNTTGQIYEPNAEMFRKIAEAYAVLSVPESRAAYDISNKKSPENIYKSKRDSVMETRRKERDISGHVPGPKPMRGSYAESRLKQLEKERQLHNVNHLGFYNGGIPRKGANGVRGNAWANPGYFHDPAVHNWQHTPHPDSLAVTDEEALAFNQWMNADKPEYQKVRPYYTLNYDPEMKYKKERSFSLLILFLFGFSWWASRVYDRERKRNFRTARENIENDGHSKVVNMGGVVMKTEFDDFLAKWKKPSATTE